MSSNQPPRKVMGAVEPIIQAYQDGCPALLLTGRSLYDLDVDCDGKIRPLLEGLRRSCRAQFDMVLVSYSLAGGLEWDSPSIGEDRDRRQIEEILRSHRLLDVSQDHNEVIRVVRGISTLSRTPREGQKWANARNIRFAFLLEFAEHLMPGSLTNGTQTDFQLIAIELAHMTAQSLALRASGNLVMFHGRDGLVDELVSGALQHVRLRQPGVEQKKAFLAAALSVYDKSSIETGLTPESVAHLVANTPNRGLESLIRASHYSGRPLAAEEISKQKHRDVETLSERTLTALNTTRVENLNLCGRNISTPRLILERYARALLRGERSIPANVLLVGSPGTGKTDLALWTARLAKVAAYQMHSPKTGIVGETERLARLQQTVLQEWGPNISFTDEITEALPLERSDFDGDSGASRAVMAALLTSLSDESRRGKSLLIATTNCPWRMGDAMRSRFTIIPVLRPLNADYAEIVLAIARSIDPTCGLDATSSSLLEASEIFYQKGATPRHVRSTLSNALSCSASLTADSVISAARDLCTAVDSQSGIYADLWAIKACSFQSFLPWRDAPSQYPFPSYLDGVVDPVTGELDHEELDKRLEDLRPFANV